MRPDPNLGFMRQLRLDTYEVIHQGSLLSTKQLSTLLERIADDPLDRSARLAVIGADVAPSQRRSEQILWFISNEPFLSLGIHIVHLENDDRERASGLWERALERWPNNLRVLENAIWFFVLTDQPRAIALIEDRVERLPDDADGWELAAVVFDFAGAPERVLAAAFRCFAEDAEPDIHLALLPLMRKAATGDTARLIEIALAAYREGQRLSPAPRLQAFCAALGFIALADGNADRARRHLADAKQVSTTSGPVDALARQL